MKIMKHEKWLNLSVRSLKESTLNTGVNSGGFTHQDRMMSQPASTDRDYREQSRSVRGWLGRWKVVQNFPTARAHECYNSKL